MAAPGFATEKKKTFPATHVEFLLCNLMRKTFVWLHQASAPAQAVGLAANERVMPQA